MQFYVLQKNIQNFPLFNCKVYLRARKYYYTMQKVLFLLLTITTVTLNAQQEASWCGTHISHEWMEEFYQRDKSHLERSKRSGLDRKEIPIIYHIVGRNDGTGYYTMTDLLRLHCDMQTAFLPTNLHFWVKNVNYINNTTYYNGDNTNQLFTNYNDLDVLNVYIVSQMSGVCGYSYVPRAPSTGFGFAGPNRGGIMLAANCLGTGSTTYTHEAGHYFNLPHTFFGWENQSPPPSGQPAPSTIGSSWSTMQVEKVDRSNCLTSGDGFCDTYPDYISNRWFCNQTPTLQDPNGVSFQPDGKNFMSYANDACTEYFSEDQYAEMNNTPSTHRSYLLNLPAPDMTPLAMTEAIFPNNIQRISPSLDLNLTWKKVDRADFYLIQVTNNNNFFFPLHNEIVTDTFFTMPALQANRNYKWRVRPFSYAVMCTDFTPEASFSTAVFSAEIEITNESCFGSRDGSAVLSSSSAGSLAARWNSTDPFINSQLSFNYSFTANDLTAGFYIASVIRNNTDTSRVPFYITSPTFINLSLAQVGSTLVANIDGGTPPYTIIWSNGGTSEIATNPTVGENSVILVDQAGCQKTGVVNFDPNSVNIASVASSLVNLNLYPNPSNLSAFNLDVELSKNENTTIEVFNLNGQKLKSENYFLSTGLSSIYVELSGAASGIYLVRITMGENSVTKKLTLM
jgi:hypothetical protein